MRHQPPGVVVLSACFSGARDEALHSIAETLSQSSVTCVGMWVEVEDRAAVVYDVEFARAYASGGAWRWRTGWRCSRWQWSIRGRPGPRFCCLGW